jgi:hypothetical protein
MGHLSATTRTSFTRSTPGRDRNAMLGRRDVPVDMGTLHPQRPDANAFNCEIASVVLLREEPDEEEEEEDEGDNKKDDDVEDEEDDGYSE